MQRKKIDLLLHCQWLIPVIPEDLILENHCIAIDSGKIVDLLPISSALQQFDAAEEVELNRHIVMPGLINTHSYSGMRLLRDQDADCTDATLLDSYIRSTKIQPTNPDFIQDSLSLAAAETIKTGTTCFTDLYPCNNLALDVLRNLGTRSQLSFMLSESETAFGKNAEDYIHQGLKLYDDVGNHSHINIACTAYDANNISDSVMQRLAIFANELDLPIQFNCNGLADQNGSERPLERLFNLGLLRPETQLIVNEKLCPEDIALIEKTNSKIVICAQNLNASSDNTQWVAELLQADINVSLGSAEATGNHFNLFAELKPLTQIIKGQSNSINSTQAAHLALRMATINGAKTLGWNNQIGSIEMGKFADIIAVEIDSIAFQPLYNPAVQLTHSQDANQVTHSWVAGKSILKDRKLQNLNERQLIQSAKDWIAKLAV